MYLCIYIHIKSRDWLRPIPLFQGRSRYNSSCWECVDSDTQSNMSYAIFNQPVNGFFFILFSSENNSKWGYHNPKYIHTQEKTCPFFKLIFDFPSKYISRRDLDGNFIEIIDDGIASATKLQILYYIILYRICIFLEENYLQRSF